ncbi:unnamed protein product, partial [Timema podura]|nr:unnamed protein product [Timema podura]
DKAVDALSTIRPAEGIRVDVTKWLQGDSKHSYNRWRAHMPSRGAGTTANKPLKKEEVRALYLMEKYGNTLAQQDPARDSPLAPDRRRLA